MLPDSIVRQQRLVFVDAAWKLVGERLDKIQQRPLPGRIQAGEILLAAEFRFLILGHLVREVTIYTARPIIRCVHARARNRLIAIHQIFALTETVQKNRHRADIEAMRTKPHQVVQNAGYLVEHDADVLRPNGRHDAQQFLDCHDVTVFITHHRHVIQSIHVADALAIRLGLCQLFRRPM